MLAGKRLVITGVVDERSIGYAVARRVREAGADIVCTAMPRDLESAAATLHALDPAVAVLPADLTAASDLETLAGELGNRWESVDGALHAVAFAPRDALCGPMTATTKESVDRAFTTSVMTLAGLVGALAPLAGPQGASFVGLHFDAARAWPVYNWMGVCKAGLASLTQYLARDLGPARCRVNLVAAGPIETRAGRGIPGFDALLDAWNDVPLGWDPADASAVADACCFLFSDLSRATTGAIIPVDGGRHCLAG